MLLSLNIQNFALIDSIEMNLEKGLTVITGETGAGKSILLGGLSLILGNRADHSSLKNKTKKCIIEAVFDIEEYELMSFFEKNDLDYSQRTIIRREINAQGKSRAFINDTPTTLDILKQLGSRLIDIHSQHQSSQINDTSFQIALLDALASNTDLMKGYKLEYDLLNRLSDELSQLIQQSIEAKKQEDYLNFQFQELEILDLKEGETTDLESEQEKIANSEEILKNLNQVFAVLSENDENVLSQLTLGNQLLDSTQRYLSELDTVNERFKSVFIELQDISNEIEQHLESFEYHPERQLVVEDRLKEIHRLQQKHQLKEADELIQLKETIERSLEKLSNYDVQISSLSEKKRVQEVSLRKLATRISERRLKVIPKLSKHVEKSLSELGMENARLIAEHETLDSFGKLGIDAFSFLFTANKGVEPQKISTVASGGEISRLMLAIKSLMAEHRELPTLLFDEIDTGVSGDIAEKMGEILSQMGRDRQVITITHLPQLAAKGNAHYFVFKEDKGDVSRTKMRLLSDEERVGELAKMLSGKNLTTAAINNAKELLAQ